MNRISTRISTRIPPRGRLAVGLALCLAPSLLPWSGSSDGAAGGTSPRTEPPVAELRVGPPDLQIHRPEERPRLVVLAVDEDGFMRDASEQVEISTTPAVVDVDGTRADADPTHRLRPSKPGESALTVHLQGADLDAATTVAVADSAVGPGLPVRFRDDVVPTLTRAGCNAGSCHGAASGKNGFKLSLFGDDPALDIDALTRDMRGRRLDLADPGHSLLLHKPSGQVPHKGGRKIQVDDRHYELLERWIAEGAADDAESHVALRGLEVWPQEVRFAQGEGASVPFVATAVYDDGSRRDVTDLALWTSSDGTVASLGESGRAVAGARRGESVILARFGGLAAVGRVATIPRDAERIDLPDADNPVDAAVFERLESLRIPAEPVADDSTFLRRVCLDLTGRLPSPDRVRAFLADESSDKRERLVDDLLARPEFAEMQAAAWAEALVVEERRIRRKGVHLYTRWLREQFLANRPVDEIVRDLLTTNGSSFEEPEVNFWLVQTSPTLLAENTAQAMLGIRLQCAQCHNHPFDRWTQDDYYGFAAFFRQVGRKRGEDPREQLVLASSSGEVNNPRTGKPATPRFLGGVEPDLERGESRRDALADWLVAKENPWFGKQMVDRLWRQFFGRGITEPVDDVRVSNPPANAALVAALEKVLHDHDYDIRAVARAIVLSRTYQRTASADAMRAAAGAGQSVRRLSAETLLDAIDSVLGVASALTDVRPGASARRAVGARTNSRFLELFGRPSRETVCACERRDAPTLNQILHLINGDTVAARVAARGNRIDRAVAAEDPAAWLEELFLTAFARRPTATEAERLLAPVRAAEDDGARRQAWEDVYWAVLNSREFLFQK